MAWSDAARAAALEVRRAHMKVKAEGFKHLRGLPLAREVSTNTAWRKGLADKIRGMRAGTYMVESVRTGKGTWQRHAIAQAVVSTGFRNIMRKAKRK